MTMVAGSVSVPSLDLSGNPVTSGSGFALVLFNATVAAKAAQSPPIPPPAPVLGSTSAPWRVERPVSSGDVSAALAGRLAYFRDLAGTCNGIASVIGYITSNAQVSAGSLVAHVTSQSLGRTPNPNNAATAIDAPSSPVDIPLTGAGTIA